MTTTNPIAIVGPTAVGKSAVAERIAVSLGGEIVNADSMQVYRGMDVGTAKTPPHERLVAYHCVDIAAPGEPYSAALYQRDARLAIDDIISRSRVPVVVGGTGLYVRAALDEFDFPVGERQSDVRQALELRAQRDGGDALHAELTRVDPRSAALIHPHNVRRTVRALEMCAEGQSYADQAAGFGARTPHYRSTRFIGLTMARELLYSRIDARVDAMVSSGLLDEVRRLVAEGYRGALTATQAIGYKELVPVVDGTADLAHAVAAVKQATRRYAKRQMTWFRADPRVVWVDVTGLSSEPAAATVLDLLESAEQ